MAIVAGVDGCPAGWLCVRLDTETGELTHDVFPTAAELLADEPRPAVLAIDMPIGLPDAGSRACDLEARALLGRPRGSSVFPAPVRPAIGATTQEEASRLTRAVDGRGVASQAFGLFPKIRTLDEALTPEHQTWVHEVHPEVSFRAWNGGVAVAETKSSAAGRAARRALIEARYGATPIDAVRSRWLVRQVRTDDIHDAFAALWSAQRIHRGDAEVLPDGGGAIDATGLRMEIRF